MYHKAAAGKEGRTDLARLNDIDVRLCPVEKGPRVLRAVPLEMSGVHMARARGVVSHLAGQVAWEELAPEMHAGPCGGSAKACVR